MSKCNTKTELYNAVQAAISALPRSMDFLTDVSKQGGKFTPIKTGEKYHVEYKGLTLTDLLNNVADLNILSLSTLPASVFQHRPSLIQGLVDMGVDKKFAIDLADTFEDFYGQVQLAVKADLEKFTLEYPINLFDSGTGYVVPPAVAFSMMINGLDWVSTNGGSTMFDSDYFRGQFLYGNPSADLSADEIAQLQELEFIHNGEANRIGTNVLRSLQYKPANTEAQYVYDRIASGLGMATLVALQEQGFVEVRTHVFEFSTDEVDGRHYNSGDRINVINVSEDTVDSLRDFSASFRKSIDAILGDASVDTNRPLQKPSDIIPEQIKGTMGGVPKRLQALLGKLQNVIWTKADSFDRVQQLHNSHPEVIAKLAGIVKIDKHDHIEYAKSTEASNKNKQDAINAYFQYADEGLLDRFYFSYDLMNQHRIMMRGRANPQSSHATRNLVRSHKKATYNKANMEWFKLAVLFNLGVSVDKMTSKEVIEHFDRIYADEVVQEAISAFESNNADDMASSLTKLLEADLAGDLSTITAIEALVKYRDYAENGTEFKSDIPLEIDGVSNGFAMGLLQFPTFADKNKLHKFLNQTGTYFDVNSKHLIDGAYTSGEVMDVYLELGRLTTKHSTANSYVDFHYQNEPLEEQEYLEVTKSYEERSDALAKLFPDITGKVRDLVKYPYIIYNYGGSILLITREVADKAISQMYKDLGKLQIEKIRAEKNKESTADITEKGKELEATYKALGIKVPVAKLLRINKLHEFTFEADVRTQLKNQIVDLLQPRFKGALDEMIGEYAESRSAISDMASLMQAILNVKLQQWQITFKADNSREPTHREAKKYILQHMKEFLPTHNGPWSDLESFVDITETTSDANRTADHSERISILYKQKGQKVRSRNITTEKKQFDYAGVKPALRMIINMDAVLNAVTLEQFENMLTLYDAFWGSPLDMQGVSSLYGDTYIEYGKLFGFAENTHDQLMRNYESLSNKEVGMLDKQIRDEMFNMSKEHRAWYPSKDFKALRTPRNRVEFFLDAASAKVANIKHARTELFTDMEQQGVVSYQMAVPPMQEETTLTAQEINDLETAKNVERLQGAWGTNNTEADNVRKSLDLDKTNVVETTRGGISLDNIQQIFEQFTQQSGLHYQNKTQKDAHKAQLAGILDTLKPALDAIGGVTLSVEQIDGLSQGHMNIDTGVLTVSLSRQPAPSVVGQSPQEIFTHEFVHAITETVLQQDPVIAHQIRKLRDQVQKQIKKDGGYKVFLQGLDTVTADDIALAKQQYKYLFDNPKLGNAEISEFLAYGLTNQTMSGYLKGTKATLPTRETTTLTGRLLHVWDMIVDRFIRFLRNSVNNNAYEDLLEITARIVAIQNNHQSKLEQMIRKAEVLQDKGNEKTISLAKKSAETILKKVHNPRNPVTAAIETAVQGVYVTMSENVMQQQAVQHALGKVSNVALSIYNELANGALTDGLVDQLLKVNHQIGKNRQIIEAETVQRFEDSWKSGIEISKRSRENLTSVFLRTDLSSLLDLGLPVTDVLGFVSNPAAIVQRQKTILRQLGLNQGTKIVKYAVELANYMVTGDTYLHNAHHNAYSILHEYAKSFDDNQVALLDAYITLEALKRTDDAAKQDVAKLINSEMAADGHTNAVIDMLTDHYKYVRDVKQNLFDSPMLTQKGYIVERVDNLHDIQIGTEEDAEWMRKAGYTEKYAVSGVHGVSNPVLQNRNIYISKHMPEVGFVGGILSMTNRRAKGTTLKSLIESDPKYVNLATGEVEYKRIYKDIKSYTGRSTYKARNNIKAKTGEKLMRPIRNEKGNIVDYRVQMNHEFRKVNLNPDLQYQDVMAHMKSSYVDKINSARLNEETLMMLVHEQETIYPQKPELFVNILGKDLKEQYYHSLSPESQRVIDSYEVNGTFYVRKDILHKVFGFHKKQISNLGILSKKERARAKYLAHFTQYLFEQTISKGLERVIIATFDVVFGNALSNSFNLAMRGVRPTFIARKMYEGYQEYRRLDKDIRKSRNLRHQITTHNLPSNSPEYKEYVALKERIEGNAFAEINRRGLNTLIVEDVNEANKDGYYNRLLDYMGSAPITDKIPQSIVDVAQTLYMSRATQPFRVMKHIVTVSDLLARYVLIDHLQKQGASKEAAAHEAIEAFVLYDENLDPNLQVLNDLGFTAFTKYWLRNQRAAKRLIKRNPLNVLESAAIQHTTDLDTLANVNSSFFGLDFSPTVMYQDDLLDHVTDLTLLENLRILEE